MSILKTLPLVPLALLAGYSAANAADAVVVPVEPEPVEYVRVCDAYGAGYYYIPGTETCMRISGYVRAEIKGGDDVYATSRDGIERDTYAWRSRATLRFHTAAETELGTLRTYIDLRSEWQGGANWGAAGDKTSLRFAYIELGGLRVGMDESIFAHWTGYLGKVMNDDVLSPKGSTRTNMISYTYNSGNGFSAIIGVEQGSGSDINGTRYNRYYDSVANRYIAERSYKLVGQQIDDYAPHVLGGLKFKQGWGAVSAVAAYDARNEEWAGKLRLDLNVTDQFSVWVMGGYKSMDDYYKVDTSVKAFKKDYISVVRIYNSNIGDWGGDWVVWGGGSYKFTKNTSFNFQAGYDDERTFSAAANISHQIVPGLTITPEIAYTKWDSNYGYKAIYSDAGALLSSGVRNSMKGENAFQGMLRLQRSF
ncbi:porin [Bartonella sp. HY761]|uniref:porin n=1 Tax=Bartonella sp. HY761 TaxID=2979330 RepID=UPI00220F3525|nr:porin [Bartonella sp. HY761]UXN05717.1 porin [Bartonella sp. HY761]